jgi:hypothetical protein
MLGVLNSVGFDGNECDVLAQALYNFATHDETLTEIYHSMCLDLAHDL